MALAILLVAVMISAPALVAGSTTQAQPPSLAGLPIPPNERFGLNRASYGVVTQPGYRQHLAGEAGAVWNRWPLYWYLVESENGIDYSAYDRAVAEDLQRGTQLDIVLLGTPPTYASAGNPAVPPPHSGRQREPDALRWRAGSEATASPHGSTPQNLFEPIFADGSDDYAPGKAINPNNYWARFVNLTVERYRPGGELNRYGLLPDGVGVRYWEIWNEPDVPFYWYARGPGSEVTDYLRLLKVAYMAAKAADPAAAIVIGGLSYWGREGWIEDLFEAIKLDPNSAAHGDYFDVMAWHVYSRAVDLYNRASWSRHLLRDHGFAGKEVWINEANIPVWGDPTPPQRDPGTHRGSPEEQAAFILQAYAYGFAGGADRVFTFMLYDDCWQYGEHYGLVRNPPGDYPIADCAGDGQPRPAYTAYKVAAAFLRDITASRVNSYGPGGAVDAVAFDTASGARVTVILNKFGNPVTVDLPVRGRAFLVEQTGEVRVVAPNRSGTFTLSLPAATANDAFSWEEPYYIVGSRTYVLVELVGQAGSGQILNGGFEMSLPFAAWFSGGVEPVLTSLARSGERSALLRVAPPNSGTSWIAQSLRLPVGGRPTLRFEYAVQTTQPVDGDGDGAARSYFEVTARVGSAPEEVLVRQYEATDWQRKEFDLSNYAGQLLTLTYRVRGSDYPLAAFVDGNSIWSSRIVLPSIYQGAGP